MVRRESTRIISEILNVSNCGALISEIMSKVALNYVPLHQYVQMLIKAKLLETSCQSRTVYRTTRKGKVFLKKYRELTGLLGTDASGTDSDSFECYSSSKRAVLRECLLTPALYKKATFRKHKCRVCDQPFKPHETVVLQSPRHNCIPYHKECYERALV
jgi:predicted transcriptional regulator